jgi:transcriptional regulator with XRE-family HTH domain
MMIVSQLRQDFAKRLKEIRTQRGLTQEELAKAAGLSLSFVRSVEQAIHAPSFESLQALANALNVNVKDLFDF